MMEMSKLVPPMSAVTRSVTPRAWPRLSAQRRAGGRTGDEQGGRVLA